MQCWGVGGINFQICEVLCWGVDGSYISRYGRCCFEIWKARVRGVEGVIHIEIWEALCWGLVGVLFIARFSERLYDIFDAFFLFTQIK